MADPQSMRNQSAGFSSEEGDDQDLATRGMPLTELPLQARVDAEMEVIALHHMRIARAIESFWGHKECEEYIQRLILGGDDSDGRIRVGFKAEVLTALINLLEIHKEL